MDQIQEFFQIYMGESMLVIAGILVILLIINLSILVKTSNMKKNYKKLLNGRESVNIEELLSETGQDINRLRDQINANKEKLSEIGIKLEFAVQKVGFIRYNAFAEMGSDLSFSLALLDNFQNGFVISSIYGREHASIYGKPIKDGKSTYPLSVEEMQAIDRARLGQVGEKTI